MTLSGTLLMMFMLFNGSCEDLLESKAADEGEIEHGMTPDDTLAEKLLTVEEVAAWLRVTPAWVRAHANGNRSPKLPSLKVGAFRRFRIKDIQRFLEELSRAAA